MRTPDVLIVGGGAAGLSAAIAAARGGANVTILEAGARVGRKILASGNGRCNLSNSSAGPEAYNHPEFVTPVLATHSCEHVRAYFRDMGLLTYAEDEGRIYPVTNAANSVLEVLRLECEHLGVVERLGFEAAAIAQVAAGSPGLAVTSTQGERIPGDAVVLATGGGHSLLAALGHSEVALTPVLCPIKTDPAPIRGLSGVRVRCAASILTQDGAALATERGELLFREYGVSGIMVFDLSRYLERGRALSIDFFPDTTPRELRAMLDARCATLAWRTAGTFFDGMLQSRVARAVLRAAGVDPSVPVPDMPCDRLASLLKEFRIEIIGGGEAKQAQVTRGGVAVSEIDPETMASRRVSGVFVAGETLDIDGRCGGFNLHWAWASGIVAGEQAAQFAARRAAPRDAGAGGVA